MCCVESLEEYIEEDDPNTKPQRTEPNKDENPLATKPQRTEPKGEENKLATKPQMAEPKGDEDDSFFEVCCIESLEENSTIEEEDLTIEPQRTEPKGGEKDPTTKPQMAEPQEDESNSFLDSILKTLVVPVVSIAKDNIIPKLFLNQGENEAVDVQNKKFLRNSTLDNGMSIIFKKSNVAADEPEPTIIKITKEPLFPSRDESFREDRLINANANEGTNGKSGAKKVMDIEGAAENVDMYGGLWTDVPDCDEACTEMVGYYFTNELFDLDLDEEDPEIGENETEESEGFDEEEDAWMDELENKPVITWENLLSEECECGEQSEAQGQENKNNFVKNSLEKSMTNKVVDLEDLPESMNTTDKQELNDTVNVQELQVTMKSAVTENPDKLGMNTQMAKGEGLMDSAANDGSLDNPETENTFPVTNFGSKNKVQCFKELFNSITSSKNISSQINKH